MPFFIVFNSDCEKKIYDENYWAVFYKYVDWNLGYKRTDN